MHSQIVVNPRFHGGTKIGKGGPVLAAKIGPGGPVLTGDRFFRYSTLRGSIAVSSLVRRIRVKHAHNFQIFDFVLVIYSYLLVIILISTRIAYS